MGLKVKTQRARDAAEEGFDVPDVLLEPNVWVVNDLSDGAWLGSAPDRESAAKIADWWAK